MSKKYYAITAYEIADPYLEDILDNVKNIKQVMGKKWSTFYKQICDNTREFLNIDNYITFSVKKEELREEDGMNVLVMVFDLSVNEYEALSLDWKKEINEEGNVAYYIEVED